MYDYVLLNHLIAKFHYQIGKFEWYGSIQSASAKQQSDETLEDIKAIAELEPSGIVYIAVFLSVTQIV